MNQTPSEAPAAPAPPRSGRLTGRLRIAIIVLAALAVALIAWAVLRSGGSDDSVPAQIVSAARLRALASSSAPIYWAGEARGTSLEYSEVDGRRYVRYLTGKAKAGDPRPAFLSIGTYPVADPLSVLRANAKRTHTKLQRARGGTMVWLDPNRPQSVYLAEPGAIQVEVYDPSPAVALRVALSGGAVPAK